jgi:predicted secreted protein
MAIAGFNTTVAVATGAETTYFIIDGISSCDFSDGRDLLEITDFADDNLRRRIAGLRDISASLSGDVELADNGYQLLAAAYNAGDRVYLRYLVDGTNGVMLPCLIESKDISSSVDGKVELSMSLQSEGIMVPVMVGTGI